MKCVLKLIDWDFFLTRRLQCNKIWEKNLFYKIFHKLIQRHSTQWRIAIANFPSIEIHIILYSSMPIEIALLMWTKQNQVYKTYQYLCSNRDQYYGNVISILAAKGSNIQTAFIFKRLNCKNVSLILCRLKVIAAIRIAWQNTFGDNRRQQSQAINNECEYHYCIVLKCCLSRR